MIPAVGILHEVPVVVWARRQRPNAFHFPTLPARDERSDDELEKITGLQLSKTWRVSAQNANHFAAISAA